MKGSAVRSRASAQEKGPRKAGLSFAHVSHIDDNRVREQHTGQQAPIRPTRPTLAGVERTVTAAEVHAWVDLPRWQQAEPATPGCCLSRGRKSARKLCTRSACSALSSLLAVIVTYIYPVSQVDRCSDQSSRSKPATRAGSAWWEVLRWWMPSKTTSRKSGNMAASRFPERS